MTTRRLCALLPLGLAASLACTAGTGPDPAGGDFLLASHGQPAAVVVVASNAPDSVRYAADELVRYVARISGATLAVTNDGADVQGPALLLGRSRLTDLAGVEIPAGAPRDLRAEGYILRTVGDRLVVAGNDGGPARPADPKNPLAFTNTYKGTLFAAYDLLERLGCRWYYPGDWAELVPAAPTLRVPPLDVTERPDFPVRGFWYGVAALKRADERIARDMNAWMLRNRFLPYGSVLPSAGDGSVMAPFTSNRVEVVNGEKRKTNAVFEEHPEYFALRADGTRNSHYLCLSNPDVVRIATEYAREYLRAHPEAPGFGYAPPDGAPTCECEACRALNAGFMQKPPADPRVQDISDGFYRFLNEVAVALRPEFPGVWITTTAYSGRTRPPEGVALAPNVSVHIALLGYSHHHRYDFPSWQTQERVTLYRRWGESCAAAVERPYYPPMQFHAHVPLPLSRTHAFNVRVLREAKLLGSEWEARCAFMADGLNPYVLGRCLWDADLDVDALLDEHFARFYGAAGSPVAEFFEVLETMLTTAPVDHHEEERIPELYPREQALAAVQALGDIEALVRDGDEALRRRVRVARLVADHFRAYVLMRDAEAQLDFPTAAGHARAMIAAEREAESIHPTLVDAYAEQRDANTKAYGELGANAGPRGQLVTALPAEWEFTTDPHDTGLVAQWYLPGGHGREWRPMDTTRCWEAQGLQDEALHGYDGYAWYRTAFTLPPEFEGRRIVLFVGGLNEQGWFWCNGRFAGAQPFHPYWQRWRYHQEIDLTPFVRPGENAIAIRVFNEQSFGGLFRRSFLYSPAPADRREISP